MNICEEAIISQTNNRTYGKADRWTPIHLDEGDKLYQLDMGPVYDKNGNRCINSGCFIDEDTYDLYWDSETNSFDIRQYCQDAQIAPYYDGTYKNHISEYVVGEGGLDVAYGTCENNSAYGEGGCSQIYVGEDSRSQLEKTDHQIVPTIADNERYIGTSKAHDMVEESYDQNWKLAEAESMQSLVPTNSNNNYSNNLTQEQDNDLNIFEAENPNIDLMSDIAPPETKADNAYGQSQAPEQDNSAEISR